MIVHLSEEFTDKAWVAFLTKKGYLDASPARTARTRYFAKQYRNTSKKSDASRKFETWMFVEHGAVIRRIHKKCYLEFSFEEQATLFALKWIT
jgi:hypothetical protein